MKALVFSVAALTLATASIGAAPAVRSGATVAPDWSGAWIVPEQDFSEAILREQMPGNPTAPQLQPDAAKVRDARAHRMMTGKDPDGQQPPRSNAEVCLPPGMPDVMRYPAAIEFLFTPGRVTLLMEEGPAIRRIYTDGRAHSSDTEPTYMGESIGRWEGSVLIVQTRAISDKAQMIGAVRTSGNARITERIRLRDKEHLQIETTVEDPQVLRVPWRYTRIYQRIEPRFVEMVCLDNNRDIGGGEPDLTPPAAPR